jgi:hypothetical protein
MKRDGFQREAVANSNLKTPPTIILLNTTNGLDDGVHFNISLDTFRRLVIVNTFKEQ